MRSSVTLATLLVTPASLAGPYALLSRPWQKAEGPNASPFGELAEVPSGAEPRRREAPVRSSHPPASSGGWLLPVTPRARLMASACRASGHIPPVGRKMASGDMCPRLHHSARGLARLFHFVPAGGRFPARTSVFAVSVPAGGRFPARTGVFAVSVPAGGRFPARTGVFAVFVPAGGRFPARTGVFAVSVPAEVNFPAPNAVSAPSVPAGGRFPARTSRLMPGGWGTGLCLSRQRAHTARRPKNGLRGYVPSAPPSGPRPCPSLLGAVLPQPKKWPPEILSPSAPPFSRNCAPFCLAGFLYYLCRTQN